MKAFLFAAFTILAFEAFTQPYVDPFHLRYTHAFKNNKGSGTPFNHLFIGPDLPFKLKNGGLFVISPIFEKWNIDSASNKSYLPELRGMAMALSTVIPLDKYWLLTVSVIPRMNSEDLKLDNCFQLGGILLATYKKTETLKFKFGVYANREFFGLFMLPLAGIDWRIDERNNLFGVLPGRMVFEHKLSSHFYTGVAFRAITTSYRMSNGNYLRIDDNQLSSFLDCYITKRVVLTGEAGYGIMRELKTGKEYNKQYLGDYNWTDGLFMKLSASYRVRL